MGTGLTITSDYYAPTRCQTFYCISTKIINSNFTEAKKKKMELRYVKFKELTEGKA